MKNFLKKIIIFLMIPILYFGVNTVTNIYLYSKNSIPLKKTRLLIVGDSHTQKSLDPNQFESARNISQSAEPYVLTYWKLLRIFNKKKAPDTLLLGFAPHNISEFNDLKFSNKKWSSEMFRRSYTIEKFNELDNFIEVDYSTFYKTLWKQLAFYPKFDHINYIGNYSNNKSRNLSGWRNTVERHFYSEGKKLGVSATAKNYLDSIVRLSNEYKVHLILTSSPVHEKYYNSIPTEIRTEFNNLKQKYKSQISIIDKTNMHYPDSLFKDADHLNQWGSIRFTNEVKDYLKEKRNDKM